MAKTIGVVMTEAIRSGFLDDHKIIGATRRFPENMDESTGLIEVPTDALAESICDEIKALIPDGTSVDAIGVAMPGIIRNGVVEDSPNLPQLKGARGRAWKAIRSWGSKLGDRSTRWRLLTMPGCSRGRPRRHARSARPAHPRLDHRQWHRLRALSLR